MIDQIIFSSRLRTSESHMYHPQIDNQMQIGQGLMSCESRHIVGQMILRFIGELSYQLAPRKHLGTLWRRYAVST